MVEAVQISFFDVLCGSKSMYFQEEVVIPSSLFVGVNACRFIPYG